MEGVIDLIDKSKQQKQIHIRLENDHFSIKYW